MKETNRFFQKREVPKFLKSNTSIEKEIKRRKSLEKDMFLALSTLEPIISELADQNGEASDLEAKEDWSKIPSKNRFVVIGNNGQIDNDATYRKSINFLLKTKNHDLTWIADIIMVKSRIANFDFPEKYIQDRGKVVELLANKIS